MILIEFASYQFLLNRIHKANQDPVKKKKTISYNLFKQKITTMNNTTTITLNDRFSMIKKTNGFPPQAQGGRARSRSRSRGRPQQTNVNLRGSTRNRKLLDQLEKQHKMRLALKLKNVRIP